MITVLVLIGFGVLLGAFGFLTISRAFISATRYVWRYAFFFLMVLLLGGWMALNAAADHYEESNREAQREAYLNQLAQEYRESQRHSEW